MPRKVFTAGEVLAAADVNEFLMDQAVMTFAGTAARGSAIGTAIEGMLTYLADSDTFEFWNGTAYASLVVPAPATPTIEYLVVAGGGGGALLANGKAGGGGGAGGYRTNVTGSLSGGSAVAELPLSLVNGTYTITVGSGGAGATADNNPGSIGNYSLFIQVLCTGGGGGKSFLGGNNNGGSGGGGCKDATAAGLGSILQGFNGGTANAGQNGGAGGGGAGAIGGNNIGAEEGGNGGAGLASSITGSSVTRGGGGGGGGNEFNGGAGGAGGGGAGAVNTGAGGNGTVNTGGGGGGSERAGGSGGNGGSGIIVFTVPTATTVTFSGGVTETNSTIGDKKVFVVTATSTTSETVTFA